MWYTFTMNFEELLQPGLRAEKSDTVTDRNMADAWGSGGLPVFATPAMVALMEMAAYSAVQPFLPSGWSTVGTELNIKHLSATPIQMKVSAQAELLSVYGRTLKFRVEAFDETGKIGEGEHSRVIIENEKFLSRAERKKAVAQGTQGNSI